MVSVLPTIHEAAMSLVRGISAVIPEEQRGGPGMWEPTALWYAERHHGLGDNAREHGGHEVPHPTMKRAPKIATVDDVCLLSSHMNGGCSRRSGKKPNNERN